MMSDPKSPVSSFGEPLQTALRMGCKSEVTLSFETPQLAARFRQRIMMLRKAMRRENHPDWQEAYRCGIFLEGTTVTLKPRDSEFVSVVAAAKTTPSPLSPPPLPSENSDGEPSASADPLEAFLGELRAPRPS